ncbi:MAG: APC family permease [Candidatus Ancaeobacter aquaticus]|nr:APC family permease [Candidatus Ancaeobacter aquaticus]
MDTNPHDSSSPKAFKHKVTKIVVVTTAMLTFISFWRAASIVLCDLGSSAYYAAGIAEQAIGKAAPWFILAVMLFAICVRLVYIESCGMFVRGGVYKVVKSVLGGTFAKVAVSALMFDFVLTGPVSAVCAGQYLVGLVNQLLPMVNINIALPRDFTAMILALIVIIYFWRKNVIGIGESSGKAMRIIQIASVMALLLFLWAIPTLAIKGVHFPAFELSFSHEAFGWLEGFDWLKAIGTFGVMVAFGHSILAMSGEETLAQVYREIEAPKMHNLKKAAVVITIFSICFTAGLSILSFMIIPDEIRTTQYQDNLLSGLAMNMVGPYALRFAMQSFVVIVGFLILSGAVNTSMVGANGTLNRVAEDGILTDWFRSPHKKFGTTSRIINVIAIMQLVTVVLCRGNIYALGEAYSFGVIWCFTFDAMSMLALRFKDRSPREFKVPLNVTVKGVELPIGLALIFLALLTIAIINFFTKTTATTLGLIFTSAFFVTFVISQFLNKRKLNETSKYEKVNLEDHEKLSAQICECEHEHRVLVAVRDPNNLVHLKKVLGEIDPEQTDLIVMSAKIAQGYRHETAMHHLIPDEQHLFTNVITMAEKKGMSVIPVLVASNNFHHAITQTAHDLRVQQVVLGISTKSSPEIQMEQIAMSWGNICSTESMPMVVRIIWPTREFKCQLS